MMIFAAGFGSRLRPLTNSIPKPLLKVGERTLIEYHLERARELGIEQVVINVSHLAEQIIKFVGSGQRWGVCVSYSHERAPLETAGGLLRAASMLGSEQFLLVNGDVYHECPLQSLLEHASQKMHLLMVPNPPVHPQGDFGLNSQNQVVLPGQAQTLTYAGVALVESSLLEDMQLAHNDISETHRLAFHLRRWINLGWVSGQHFTGRWCDVGTLDRLEELRQQLKVGAP